MHPALRALVVSSLSAIGCSDSPEGRPLADGHDPIVHMDGPGSQDQPVPAACEGVPASGTCEASSVLFCDAVRGAVSRVDCAAMGQGCIVDVRRGATCGTIPPGVPAEGLCQDDVALWYQDDLLHRWDCAVESTACMIETCGPGPQCCAADGTPPPSEDPPSPPPTDPPPPDSMPEPGEADCTTIGYAGICSDASTVKYCVGDEPISYACDPGNTCQVDACAPGLAECCPVDRPDPDQPDPDPPPPMHTCESVGGPVGICEGNTLLYCVGDSITEVDCAAAGKTCEMDTCLDGLAECC